MTTFAQPGSFEIVRRYDSSYYSGHPEWIPQRAEMDISLAGDLVRPEAYRGFTIDLKSGPPALYRYTPFSVYIYVDDRAAAVLEFSTAQEMQSVTIAVPADKFRLTFVSELGFTPRPGNVEQRNLATIVSSLRVGGIVPAPRKKAAVPSTDHFSHQRVSLIERTPEPVFVIGPYRSGTSILTWALGQHPNIWPLPETHWLQWMGAGALAGFWIGTQPRRNYFNLCDVGTEEYLAFMGTCIDEFVQKSTLRRAERSQFERLHPRDTQEKLHAGFEFARTLFSSKRRWADGTPENAGHMAMLRKLFPAATFICTTRNPLDVITSMLHFEQAGGESASIEQAADMWRRMTELTLLAARAFGSDFVRFVTYEQLIATPEAILGQLFDFVSEPRFPKAAICYANRINSSSVSNEDRDKARPKIEKFLRNSDIPSLYDTVQAMIGSSWEPESEAQEILDERLNAFVKGAVKGALPGFHLSGV